MTFSKNWHLINHFSLNEAAALWCGLDPGPNAFSHPDVTPIKRFIEDELARWQLKITVELLEEEMARKFKPPQTIDEISRSARVHSIARTTTVSRQWLMELARSKGARPAFLFDPQMSNQSPEMAVKTVLIKAPSKPAPVDLEAAYIKRRDEWPSDKTTPSEREDWDFLKTHKPDITRNRARQLRKKLAPQSWKQSGKRKSSA